jgi:hypothetical protein
MKTNNTNNIADLKAHTKDCQIIRNEWTCTGYQDGLSSTSPKDEGI